MNELYLSVAVLVCFANDNDAMIPELWSDIGLAILEENMVVANLVNRSFENDIKDFGDVVNTRRPAQRKGRRRTDADEYVEKDVTLTNVRVTLDQWFYDSFIIKDGEQTKSMADLIDMHLRPAMQSIARMVDRSVLGRVHAYLKTPTARVGRLGAISSSNAKDYVLDARELLNIQKAPNDNRRLLLAPSAETAMLKTDQFISAEKRGDGGNALEQARLGHILGFDTFMGQNVNYINTTNVDTIAGTITNALAAGGSGSQASTVTAYEAIVGEFATVAGNDQPSYITARTASTNTTAVTMNEANKHASGAGAVLTVYKACDVKGNFASGTSTEITVDGHTASKPPQVGQLIAFGTGTRHVYTVIESEVVSSTETKLLLDRPLEVLLTDGDKAFPGPAGSMNLAFNKDFLALVTRPLAIPANDLGVKAASSVYNNVSMRVVMQYDSKKGGTRVNFDILAGVAVLDQDLGVVVLG